MKLPATQAIRDAPRANHRWYLPPCMSQSPCALRKTTNRYNCRLATVVITITLTIAVTNFADLCLKYLMVCFAIHSWVKDSVRLLRPAHNHWPVLGSYFDLDEHALRSNVHLISLVITHED